MFRLFQCVLICALVLIASACGRKEAEKAPARPATPEELVAEWKNIAANPGVRGELDIDGATVIGEALALQGPNGLDPIMDVLGDAAADPRTKMLAVMTIKPYIQKENVPRLIAMTGPEFDKITRANAGHLLGWLREPDAEARALELLDDADPWVRMAAFHVTLLRGEPKALAMVEAVWADADTLLQDRSQIVNGLPATKAPEHLHIFAEALDIEGLEPSALLRAITFLAQFGDSATVPTLEKAIEDARDPEFRAAAEEALAGLKSRLEAATTELPAPGGVETEALPAPGGAEAS